MHRVPPIPPAADRLNNIVQDKRERFVRDSVGLVPKLDAGIPERLSVFLPTMPADQIRDKEKLELDQGVVGSKSASMYTEARA
jgi:hypothetical protein